MVAIGYLLTARGWFDEKIQQVFSKLVIKVALPAFMVSNLTTNYDKAKLTEAASGLYLPLLAMIITYSFGFLLSKLLKIKAEHQGIFRIGFALSNTIFIGLPVNVSLFGEQSIPYVLLYYICNTTFFWTIGIYDIRKSSGDTKGHIFSLESLKGIVNPPIIAFILTISLILLQIPVPKFLLEGCKYIGNLTTPISTLFVGIVLYSLKLKDIKINRDSLFILFGRFIFAPAITALLIMSFDIPLLMKKVFIIESAMPVMTQAAIAAKAYNGDHKYAAVLGALSTLISLIFIPIYMIIFSYL
jgi:predicted permease